MHGMRVEGRQPAPAHAAPLTLPPLHPPPLQAESRDHRRWIERINNKLREKGKKDEFRRIREFLESAERQDPRWVWVASLYCPVLPVGCAAD
jgi:hypothetical protein